MLHMRGKIQQLRASCKDLPRELMAEALADRDHKFSKVFAKLGQSLTIIPKLAAPMLCTKYGSNGLDCPHT